jgi:cytochrome b involved in lipid metabolism
MSKTFTKVDVAANGKPDSLWVVIDEDIYDLTSFQDEHPGMLSDNYFYPFPLTIYIFLS